MTQQSYRIGTQESDQSTIRKSKSLQTRLLIAFIAVTIIPVLITGGISSYLGSINTRNRLTNQLESVATLKESEVNTWLQMLNLNLANLLSKQDLTQLITVLLEEPGPQSAEFQDNHDQLQEELRQNISKSNIFDEIFILNLEGTVVLSTEAKQEGKSFRNQSIYTEGIKNDHISPPLYSPYLESYRIILSQPIFDLQQNIVGVLAGRANLELLNQIMQERAGLGETGETYLVGDNHVLITTLRSGDQYLTVRSEGAHRAIEDKTAGNAAYSNALGESVIGVYHWLPELNVALLAEQETREAFSSISTTLLINISVVSFSILLTAILATVITRSLTNPIRQLAQKASEVASGNLDLALEINRQDEIGLLAQSFSSMTLQLKNMIAGLEERVAERTDLLEKRSSQLQLAAEISRDINTTLDLDELLDQAVYMIRERFGFYHAGIFLVDHQNEYAVLRAATGEAGRQMLEQEHRLKIGAEGIVGEVARSGSPHIALDVGEDAVHFKNPYLPKTRSEMALPLRVGNRIIGALDVQSQEAQAFDSEDITILQTMADQLAIAIENARLIRRLNETVQELELTYMRYTRESWRAFTQSARGLKGYRFQHLEILPVSDLRPEAAEALQKGETVVFSSETTDEMDPNSVLAVPIKLREQIIGVLNLRFKGANVPVDTIKLVEEAAARLALVLENARLLDEAQRFALREQQINVLSSRIHGSTNVESVLQTTVREIGKALGVSRSFIQLGGFNEPNDNPDPSPPSNHPSKNGGNGNKV